MTHIRVMLVLAAFGLLSAGKNTRRAADALLHKRRELAFGSERSFASLSTTNAATSNENPYMKPPFNDFIAKFDIPKVHGQLPGLGSALAIRIVTCESGFWKEFLLYLHARGLPYIRTLLVIVAANSHELPFLLYGRVSWQAVAFTLTLATTRL